LLRRATATLIDQLADLNDHHLAIFDDVIVSLALDVETEARVALAERLADLPRAPKKTMRALALDEKLSVARPLIERSPCLDDETLFTIINEKSAEFLSLVARRRSLPAHLTDLLIIRADEALLVEIAGNERAPFTDTALRILAERALTHRTLYRVLRTRPDLSLRHIGAMIEAARHRAQADADLRALDEDMLSKALALETATLIARDPNLALSGRDGLAKPSRADQLSTQDAGIITELLEREQIDDALAALAEQSGVATDMVKRAFHAPHHEPLFYVLRSQNLSWDIVRRFMQHKHGAMNGEFEAELNAAYCALASDTAKRIAAFMAERKSKSGEIDITDIPLSRSA
jgi:uncharacterized protein (DUF2336 family)